MVKYKASILQKRRRVAILKSKTTKDYSKIKWNELTPQEKHLRVLSLKVLNEMKRGKSLTRASKELGLSPKLVKLHIRSAIFKRKGRWRVKKRVVIERKMLIYEKGRIVPVIIKGDRSASLIGRYFADVKKALKTRNKFILGKYKRKHVIDVLGKRHKLETVLKKIFRIEERKEESEFFTVYRR